MNTVCVRVCVSECMTVCVRRCVMYDMFGETQWPKWLLIRAAHLYLMTTGDSTKERKKIKTSNEMEKRELETEEENELGRS